MTLDRPSPHRARRVRIAAVAVTVTALAGGAIAWAVARSGGTEDMCRSLIGDDRIRSTLGSAYSPDMKCSSLGPALKKATMGTSPGRHTLDQANAMRSALFTMSDKMRDRKKAELPAELREPVADILADYSADTHQLMGVPDVEYIKHVFPWQKAWEDANGVHVAVNDWVLIRVVRAAAEDPTAYATLRWAESTRAAAELAGVTHNATGFALEGPISAGAKPFGALDGVAVDITASLPEQEVPKWEKAVMSGLAARGAQPPTYAADAPGHVAGTWARDTGGSAFSALARQTDDMVSIWAKASGHTAESVAEATRKSRDGAESRSNWAQSELKKLRAGQST